MLAKHSMHNRHRWRCRLCRTIRWGARYLVRSL